MGDDQDHSPRRRRRALLLLAGLVVVLAAGAGVYAIGVAAGDDSEQVSGLEGQLRSANDEVATLKADGEDLQSENAELNRTIDDLRLDPDEYAGVLQGILVPFAADFQKLSPMFDRASGTGETKRLLKTAERELDTAISDLNEINPPAEVTDPHDRILAAFNDLSVRFGDTSEALISGSKAEVRSAARDLQDAGRDFQRQLDRAAARLRGLGIDPGPGVGAPV